MKTIKLNNIRLNNPPIRFINAQISDNINIPIVLVSLAYNNSLRNDHTITLRLDLGKQSFIDSLPNENDNIAIREVIPEIHEVIIREYADNPKSELHNNPRIIY
ncbi:hypothetical protein [Herpetosiphon gulosus]|uniref:Uncharacterized protein n=1 Tax=Herpetosiphon gulosus TaxID=1973496 RepID=A0ABP9X0R3_9CHLR